MAEERGRRAVEARHRLFSRANVVGFDSKKRPQVEVLWFWGRNGRQVKEEMMERIAGGWRSEFIRKWGVSEEDDREGGIVFACGERQGSLREAEEILAMKGGK